MPWRPIARCVYAVAIAAILSPAAGLILQAWPPQLGSLQWRFGFGGLLASAPMMPALGLLGIFWASRILEQRLPVLVFAILSIIGVAVLATGTVLFILDAVQLRRGVVAAGKPIFDHSTVAALLNYVLMTVVYVTFSVQGVRTLKQTKKVPRKAATPLIRGTEAPGA